MVPMIADKSTKQRTSIYTGIENNCKPGNKKSIFPYRYKNRDAMNANQKKNYGTFLLHIIKATRKRIVAHFF